jgi:hypothetical protein
MLRGRPEAAPWRRRLSDMALLPVEVNDDHVIQRLEGRGLNEF